MERILVAAAFDPTCPTGITASATLTTAGSSAQAR
jgi:hypothetical protein